MSKTKDIVASLEAITIDVGVTMYEFLPEAQHPYPKAKQSPLIFILTAEQVMHFFPAGQPVLGHHFLLRVGGNTEHKRLLEIFDLASEVVLAEDVPGYQELEQVDLQGGQAMEFKERQAQMDKYLEEIRQDDGLQHELDQMIQEATEERQAAIDKRLSETGVEQFLDTPVQTEEEMPLDLSEQGRVTGD